MSYNIKCCKNCCDLVICFCGLVVGIHISVLLSALIELVKRWFCDACAGDWNADDRDCWQWSVGWCSFKPFFNRLQSTGLAATVAATDCHNLLQRRLHRVFSVLAQYCQVDCTTPWSDWTCCASQWSSLHSFRSSATCYRATVSFISRELYSQPALHASSFTSYSDYKLSACFVDASTRVKDCVVHCLHSQAPHLTRFSRARFATQLNSTMENGCRRKAPVYPYLR